MATTILEKVTPHASRLEDAADRMDKDGIGGHPTRGHAAVLRDMAADLRATAARSKMPYEVGSYDSTHGRPYYAAEEIRAGLEQIGAIDASGENSMWLQRIQQEATFALKKLGVNTDKLTEGKKLSAFELDTAMRGKPTQARIQAKALAFQAGFID
jgi:hypothetical protein